ncbi:MAG TPA: carboxypeptidase-like regulatory domain-containing protein [Pyrinomonadaceae bacterium]|nr:carboxypeptidase-like regulatory domain-containing protein [Pyrinomonadaceae bacterium]
MRFNKTAFAVLLSLLIAGVALGQDKDKSLGSIKGKVRVETGTPAGVTVVVRRGQIEVTRVQTEKGGDFKVGRLNPGIYGLTFRKAGLSIGTIEEVEVKAGKTRSLGDRLVLTVDEGSLAFLSGSVFSADGRSVPNAKVELARVLEDGSAKKIDGRLTTETGSFKFRLSPDAAKYRVSVKPDGAEPVSTDVQVDGAAVYRVALNLPPRP